MQENHRLRENREEEKTKDEEMVGSALESNLQDTLSPCCLGLKSLDGQNYRISRETGD